MTSNAESHPDTEGAENFYAQSRARSKELRASLMEKLRAEEEHELVRRLSKCGQPLTLRCADCQTPRHVETRCDLKWCPACQPALAARTADRYARMMAHIQWPLNVTLTCKNFDDGDPLAMRHVRRAWGRLRRLRWFRARCLGGIVGFELTSIGNGFHAHAHAILDCRWLAVDQCAPRVGASRDEWKKAGQAAAKEVGEQWSLCCRRPASMKVRRVWTSEGGLLAAIKECVKYSVKGSDLAENDQPAGPIIRALDGTRLVTSFGSCFGKPEFKRQRSAPGLCECGSCAWMPEDVLARIEMRGAARAR